MESWQLSHRYLENHSPSPQAWSCCLPNGTPAICSSIPPGGCLNFSSQEVFYASFRELIVSCSILEKIDSSRVSFLLVVMLNGVLKARCQDQDDAMNQHLREEQLDHEDCVSFVSPLCSYLMS